MSISTATSATNTQSVLDQYSLKTETKSSKDLGKNEFLELLVAQLNNQDPLSPQENGEFIAQLAQFSQVEGIEKLNSSMGSLLSGYQSSQALQASSLVGRKVIAAINLGTRRIATFDSEVLVLGAMPTPTEVILLQPDRDVANGTRIG